MAEFTKYILNLYDKDKLKYCMKQKKMQIFKKKILVMIFLCAYFHELQLFFARGMLFGIRGKFKNTEFYGCYFMVDNYNATR